MIEGSNVVVISGGITKDPEVVGSGAIAKLGLAVDYAANDKAGGSTGYFDVTYFLNNDESRNAAFVKKQISEGKMKKGSQISIVGRLVQERWTSDEGNRSKVVIVAESISYVKGGMSKDSGSSTDAGEAANIPEF